MIKEYTKRINKAFDYIEANFDRQMTLDELAGVANFSKFHFNRIFTAIVGETPFRFIQRIRLEKAANMLVYNRDESIGAIAQKCGFSDISVFSRNFRTNFGVSASAFRATRCEKSNFSQTVGNNDQSTGKASMYFCRSTNSIKWRSKMELLKSVEVKDLPRMNLAYIRHIGPYKGNEKLFEGLWNRLFSWAGPRGLIGGPGFASLVIYHDDPNITGEDKLRMSVCITVPEGTKTDGEVGKMELAAAKYVVARFNVDATQFQEAWNWLYGQWFPESGYQPDDRPCFEMYPEEPKNGRFTVDICVPVKPL
ncbi:MAG: AraC family transcriptional regulator [Bacteroidetes bacterium]|nr:AraC family transcriptional regulator [Bacteroidota bacterium]